MPLGPEEAQAESSIWMFGNGGGWVDESGTFVDHSAENVEAFEYMGGLVADGLTQPNPAPPTGPTPRTSSSRDRSA